YLYYEASEERGTLPGSQAGQGDLFSSVGDFDHWDASANWHENLRAMAAANMTSGAYSLNAPYFNLYSSNLTNIQTWTAAQFPQVPGICVPETMRYTGQGYETENWQGAEDDCVNTTTSGATWNARTMSTGAEIALNVWNQYQMTKDANFLATNYPLISNAAEFLLNYYFTVDTAGNTATLKSTAPLSNAHETQWDVHDPTIDLAAMKALFPVAISAAQNQQTDSALVSQLTSAESQIPDYPRVNLSNTSTVLTSAQAATADAAGTDIIALSYDPTAQIHNAENINLEPVWPFGQIGDDPAGSNTITNLAKRTFDHRPFVDAEIWSFDAMDAARLGRAGDFESNTKALITHFQSLINGLSQYNPTYEGDLEQSATVAASTNEALVQSYDGTVRIAPAWPSDWNVDGSVYILGGAKVDVQVRSGVPSTVGIEAKTSTTYTVRSPWPGQQVQVINAGTGAVVVAPTSAATLTVPVTAGTNYLIEQTAAPTSSLTYQAVTGTPATTARVMSSAGVSIGLPAVLPGNIALTGTASQSSTLSNGNNPIAAKAIDDDTDGWFNDGSVSSTNDDQYAWWQDDLGSANYISSINIWNRTDCCQDRLSDYWVFVSNTPFNTALTPTQQAAVSGVWSSHQTTQAGSPTSVTVGATGRYVMIQLSGTNYLSLAEVQVMSGPDLAKGKTATQSSTSSGATAARAVDGSTDGYINDGSVSSTNSDPNAWWQVDLGSTASVSSIDIYNRTDPGTPGLLTDYWVFVSNSPFTTTLSPTQQAAQAGVWSSHQVSQVGSPTTLNVGATGRYVMVQLSGTASLSLAEVEVFGQTNLAQGQAATQSSTLNNVANPTAAKAVDGNTDGSFADGSVSTTNSGQNAWWQADLGSTHNITSINIYNRTDCCQDRLSDYWVFVSNTPFNTALTPTQQAAVSGVWSSHQTNQAGSPTSIPAGTTGRYVMIQLSGTNYLSLAEVQVMGT
ncbi:discoidin domain-containing protein, partial [Streptomyces sp. NPDC020801]